jgi:phenylalanyl-tRNA synthetase beta chain
MECSFNKIVRRDPRVCTTGAQLPVNKLTDQLRAEIARAGYSEALTFALVTHPHAALPCLTI